MIHRGELLVTGSVEEVRSSADPIVRRFVDREPAEDAEEADRFRRWMTERVKDETGGEDARS